MRHVALLAYVNVSLAHLCCKINSNWLQFSVISMKILGSVNLLTRGLLSTSAVCKTCEKVNLYHGCKHLRSKAEAAVSLLESRLLAVMF